MVCCWSDLTATIDVICERERVGLGLAVCKKENTPLFSVVWSEGCFNSLFRGWSCFAHVEMRGLHTREHHREDLVQ